MRLLVASAGAFLLLSYGQTSAAYASKPAPLSPVGYWRTVDDRSGNDSALVRIVEESGVLSGSIVKLFATASSEPNPVCSLCPPPLRNQPVLGMKIVQGLRSDGRRWEGGTILDPGSGKRYRCRVELSSDGQRLTVRGYIGIPTLGRSQTWHRVEPAAPLCGPQCRP